MLERSARTPHTWYCVSNKRALKIMNSLFFGMLGPRWQQLKKINLCKHENRENNFARALLALAALHVLLQLHIPKREISEFVCVCNRLQHSIQFLWCGGDVSQSGITEKEFYACCTDMILQQPLALCGLCLSSGLRFNKV